mmetsp:Transcript_55410/g.108478  ORF Transcript_55410/g.108478 Transcript_55410/m.108478 type:complete len:83 (+) Transcript_55410:711-959(+)
MKTLPSFVKTVMVSPTRLSRRRAIFLPSLPAVSSPFQSPHQQKERGLYSWGKCRLFWAKQIEINREVREIPRDPNSNEPMTD